MAVWYPNDRPLNLPTFIGSSYERFLMRLYLAVAIAELRATQQPPQQEGS